MRRNATRIASLFRVSVVLRAIIFGVALLHLISTRMWVSRWYREFGAQPGDSYPDAVLVVPFVLVLASALLLVGRWWGYLPAFCLGGWLLYWLGYGGLRGVSNAHDQPLFSLYVLRVWVVQKCEAQPQEFLEIFLALVIVVYVAFALSRRPRRAYA
jgi:hypothetical protein